MTNFTVGEQVLYGERPVKIEKIRTVIDVSDCKEPYYMHYDLVPGSLNRKQQGYGMQPIEIEYKFRLANGLDFQKFASHIDVELERTKAKLQFNTFFDTEDQILSRNKYSLRCRRETVADNSTIIVELKGPEIKMNQDNLVSRPEEGKIIEGPLVSTDNAILDYLDDSELVRNTKKLIGEEKIDVVGSFTNDRWSKLVCLKPYDDKAILLQVPVELDRTIFTDMSNHKYVIHYEVEIELNSEHATPQVRTAIADLFKQAKVEPLDAPPTSKVARMFFLQQR